jgi:hypothetical protein
MQIGDMLVARERVADQHRVAALGIERAIGLIAYLEWSKIDAGIKCQWLVHAEAHDERMRIVSLARAVGGIKCDTEIGFDHGCDPAGDAKQPPNYATA